MKIDDLICKLGKSNSPSQLKSSSISNQSQKNTGNNQFKSGEVEKHTIRNSASQYSQNTNNVMYNQSNKNLKIIGITGSKGKSTTAFIIHNYLKYLGYKSVLYSSICIDSPLSFNSSKDEVENPLRDERMVLDALVQAKEYQADFLILEVNERAISKGYVQDIPFDVKLITNIIPEHNSFFYQPDEYVNLKKSFLNNALDRGSICIFGIDGKNTFDSLNEMNIKNKKIFSSKYIANVRGVKEDYVDYCMYSDNKNWHSLNGMEFSIKFNNNEYSITTNMIMPYNALNITAAISVLDTLGVFEINYLNEMISNIVIPGRDELIKLDGRTIIVNPHLIPQIEILDNNRTLYNINNLIVVSGTSGDGYKTWKKEFSDSLHEMEKKSSMKFAYNYLKNHTDLVYITTNDIGSSNASTLLNTQAGYLDIDTKYELIEDRQEAIRRAVTNSKPGDVIYISGRGNRRVFCESKDKIKLYKDVDIVNSIVNNTSTNKL